ncbi:MAG: radical SAM protein [Pseudomonadota bacterium]
MKRPNIMLVNPWIHDFAAFDLWAKPLGLLVLSSMLRQHGWNPVLLDCVDTDHPSLVQKAHNSYGRGKFHKTLLEKPAALQCVPRIFSRYGIEVEEIRKDLENIERPEAILVTSLMTYWYTGVSETVDLIREAFPGVPIILGGIYASLMPDHARRSIDVDELLAGPGESVLVETLLRRTRIHPVHSHLDSGIQFTPDLKLLRNVRFLPLLTSRGCPYRCVYCASRILQPHYLRRRPSDVIREIELAVLEYGVQEIVLYDDAFLCDSNKYAMPILKAFDSFRPALRWHSPNGLHVSEISSGVALAMKRAGFSTIRLGLESSSDDFHGSSGGKTSWTDFTKAVEYLKDAGFESRDIGVYLLVGLPGQTASQIEHDVEMALNVGTYPKLAEYSPIPGSALWNQSVQKSHYPIASEPLYQNCSLLPVAEPGVNWEFLSQTRKSIQKTVEYGGSEQNSVCPSTVDRHPTCC